MAAEITRRDFLNGVAIGVGGVLLSSYGGQVDAALSTEVLTNGLAGSGEFANYYPPTLTGMRGSHKGSFEVAHALAWQGQKPEQYQALDEQYDLVVVGTGMSGLAAAWYYRKKWVTMRVFCYWIIMTTLEDTQSAMSFTTMAAWCLVLAVRRI